MKRASEGEFGKALRGIDLRLYTYKPPDDARNWKPCDYMVWFTEDDSVKCSWIECKDVDAVDSFSLAELRPAQKQGIAEAARLGIPYWVAVWWRRHRFWTISDGARLVEHGGTSVPRVLLMSRYGVQTTSAQLGSTIKSVLLGEV